MSKGPATVDPELSKDKIVGAKGRRVRAMFGSIAHRYDLVNHLLSLSIDRWWRFRVRRHLIRLLPPGSHILDLCTGTGDLAFNLADRFAVVGCDFCHPMLTRARVKAGKRNLNTVAYVEGDALQLPLRDESFEGATVAFGLRNLERLTKGIDEIGRILKPQGLFAILEFSVPRMPGFKQLYLFYFTRLLPRIGEVVSGREGPYSYLPESVRTFPEPEEILELLTERGFVEAVSHSLTGGIVTLYLARRGN